MCKIIIAAAFAVIASPIAAFAEPLVLTVNGPASTEQYQRVLREIKQPLVDALNEPTQLHAPHVATVHGSVQKLASRVQEHRAVGRHNAFPLPIPLPPMPPPLPSPTPAQPVGDLATFLATVAIPDLQNAASLAAAQNPPDITAATCWNGLIPIVQQIQAQLPQTNGSTPFGVATAVQIARDFINAPTSPIIKQVNLSCAALYMDTKVGLVNFAAQFAGIFAGAAIISPIKPIPIP